MVCQRWIYLIALSLAATGWVRADEPPVRRSRPFVRYDARWDERQHEVSIPVDTAPDEEERVRLRDVDPGRDRSSSVGPAFSFDPSMLSAVPPPPPPEQAPRTRMWIQPTLENEELGALLWGEDTEESAEPSGWGWLADNIDQRQRLRAEQEAERLRLEEEEEEEAQQALMMDTRPREGGLLFESPLGLGPVGLANEESRESIRFTNGEIDRLLSDPAALDEDIRQRDAAWQQNGQRRESGAADGSRGASDESQSAQDATGTWRTVLLEQDTENDFRPTADFSRRIYAQPNIPTMPEPAPQSWGGPDQSIRRNDGNNFGGGTDWGNIEQRAWSGSQTGQQEWTPVSPTRSGDWSADWSGGADWTSPPTVESTAPGSTSIPTGFSEPRRSVHDAGWMLER